MLTRIRIEVSDEVSATAVSDALDNYERAVQALEARRFDLEAEEITVIGPKGKPEFGKDFGDLLGREVTDEVIEYDASLPGYKGRRVVCFKRWDTRNGSESPPESASTEAASSGKVSISGVHLQGKG